MHNNAVCGFLFLINLRSIVPLSDSLADSRHRIPLWNGAAVGLADKNTQSACHLLGAAEGYG